MSICLKSGLTPAIRSMIDYKVSLNYEESTYLPRSHCMEHFPEGTALTREIVTGCRNGIRGNPSSISIPVPVMQEGLEGIPLL